jgi:ElaB/YqjD/DUF883 family membrane-anchored ribosome-binding protein
MNDTERELMELRKRQEQISSRMQELASADVHKRVGDATDWVDSLGEAVTDVANKARDKATEFAFDAKGQAKKAAHKADDYIRENPWMIIGAAFAVGAALGALLTRDRD